MDEELKISSFKQSHLICKIIKCSWNFLLLSFHVHTYITTAQMYCKSLAYLQMSHIFFVSHSKKISACSSKLYPINHISGKFFLTVVSVGCFFFILYKCKIMKANNGKKANSFERKKFQFSHQNCMCCAEID